MKFLSLIGKNVFRNLLRSSLTALGTMVLVFVVTLVWSVLSFLDAATQEKSQNLKGIVTERWQIPSQMPFSYAASLEEGAARKPGDRKPMDSMTWQFYGGSIDPKNQTFENTLFAIATEPSKLNTMMDELDSLPEEQAAEFEQVIRKMEQTPQGLVLGQGKLAQLNKRVGDRLTIYSMNYRGIDLEFEIVGLFPPGRYDQSASFNRQYLLNALDMYPRTHNGRAHPLANKTLNLVWLRMEDMPMFSQIAEQIETSPTFSNPAVKFETASSGVSTFLDAYRDLIWGMRWLLAPAILIVLSLVIANSISISVRERRTELAVLKVLGFRPYQILILILGEALLIGGVAGWTSATLTFVVVNYVFGGLTFPIAFFSAFFIPLDAIWWGLAIGISTALVGSLVPAWSARTVQVSEVFAKVG